MENNSSRDRLLEVIRISGLSKMEFAEKIGVSAGTISHITSTSDKGRKAEMSENVANKIISTFPSLRLRYDWLMYGEGPMNAIDTSERSQPTLFDLNLQNPTPTNSQVDNNVQSSNLIDASLTYERNNPENRIDGAVDYQRETEKAAAFPSHDINSTKLRQMENSRLGAVNESLGDFQKGNKGETEPQIERIVMFYSDGTFAEYRPRRK